MKRTWKVFWDLQGVVQYENHYPCIFLQLLFWMFFVSKSQSELCSGVLRFGTIQTIEYDPYRNARICLVKYEAGIQMWYNMLLLFFSCLIFFPIIFHRFCWYSYQRKMRFMNWHETLLNEHTGTFVGCSGWWNALHPPCSGLLYRAGGPRSFPAMALIEIFMVQTCFGMVLQMTGCMKMTVIKMLKRGLQKRTYIGYF